MGDMMRRSGVGRRARVCCWLVRRCMRLLLVGVVFSLLQHGAILAHDADSLFTEILVDVVDVILEGSGIDEKFLGVTLFALVPNTTEFMNAMSFALNGNISLRYVLWPHSH